MTNHFSKSWLLATAATFFIPAIFSSGTLAQEQVTSSVKVVQAVPAKYPPIALAANANGKVIVEVEIDAQGKVTSAKTIEGHALLKGAAEKAASRWVFTPLAQGTETRTVRLWFQFTLVPRNGTQDEIVTIFWPPYGAEVRDVAGR